MGTVECKNIYISKDEEERAKKFNKLWLIIVNLMINSKL